MQFVALSNAAFTARIIVPHVPTAGDTFNIECRLDGVERLAVTPMVGLSFVSAPGGTAGNHEGARRVRIFDPWVTMAAGMYTCFASVSVPLMPPFFGGGTVSKDIQVQSMLHNVYYVMVKLVIIIILYQFLLPSSLSPSLVPLTPPHCMRALLST